MVHAADSGPEELMSTPNLDETLLALADPTRRRVVDLLRKKPQRPGDLAAALDVSPPRLSRHLRILRKSGLIEDSGASEAAGGSEVRDASGYAFVGGGGGSVAALATR